MARNIKDYPDALKSIPEPAKGLVTGRSKKPTLDVRFNGKLKKTSGRKAKK